MAMWDVLGQNLTSRQRMEQALAQTEDQKLDAAMQELQQRQARRTRPGPRMALSSPGSDAYFRRQGMASDTAFMKSYLETGERPRVRVGYTDDEGPGVQSHGPVQGGPFQTGKPRGGVVGGPFQSRHGRGGEMDEPPPNDDAFAIQQLLQAQRLKQQGF